MDRQSFEQYLVTTLKFKKRDVTTCTCDIHFKLNRGDYEVVFYRHSNGSFTFVKGEGMRPVTGRTSTSYHVLNATRDVKHSCELRIIKNKEHMVHHSIGMPESNIEFYNLLLNYGIIGV